MVAENYKQYQGFTLVELSIVLIIIGLIISGVLAGKSLIKSSQINAVIKEYNSFNLAINSFYIKYDGIPGDFDEAVEYRIGSDNGNGDWIIGNTNSSNHNHIGELPDFWEHLSKAKMIHGLYSGHDEMFSQSNLDAALPKSKYDGLYWGTYRSHFNASYVQAGSTQGVNKYFTNYYLLGVTSGTNYTTKYGFTPLDVFAIDTKADDGLPFTGTIQVRTDNTDGLFNGTANPRTPATYIQNATDTDNSCTTGTTAVADYSATYHINNDNLKCVPALKMSQQ
jgi:prepilin-type N-terminal cleavage/methylation domain-containing protein